MNASTNRTRGFLPPGCRGYPITSELAANPTLRAQRMNMDQAVISEAG
jgi:hypothetical protein